MHCETVLGCGSSSSSSGAVELVLAVTAVGPCQLTSVGGPRLPPVLGAAELLQVALKLSALKQQRAALQKEIKWIVKRDI